MESATANIDATTAASVRQRLAAFAELTKPRIAVMLLLTAAAGYYLGSGPVFEWPTFIAAMAGILLLAFGVATLNQSIERRTDALMDRTSGRPLPTGKVSIAEAVIFGVLLCLAAEVILLTQVNVISAVLGLSVIAGYVLLYTPLKTRSSLSTAIGAIPGAMPPLMGWTAASGNITLSAWALFVMLFLWQFPHFLAIAWMYKEDYTKAGILMLPVVEPTGKITARQIVMFGLMLFTVGFAPYVLGLAGNIYLGAAAVIGGWFLVECWRASRALSFPTARRLLLVSVIYLPLIFGLLVLDKR